MLIDLQPNNYEQEQHYFNHNVITAIHRNIIGIIVCKIVAMLFRYINV